MKNHFIYWISIILLFCVLFNAFSSYSILADHSAFDNILRLEQQITDQETNLSNSTTPLDKDFLKVQHSILDSMKELINILKELPKFVFYKYYLDGLKDGILYASLAWAFICFLVYNSCSKKSSNNPNSNLVTRK